MTVTVSDSPADLEAVLSDDANVRDIFADAKTAAAWFDEYAKKINQRNPEMSDEVREQVQAVARQFLLDNGAGESSPVDLAAKALADRQADAKVATGRGAAYNAAAPGARIDRDVPFASTGEFLQAVWHRAGTLANRADLAAKRGQVEQIQAAYSSTVPAEGGFLIPETLRSQLLSVALESAVVRSRAMVLPMNSLRLPIPMIDSTTNSGSVFGGIIGYWTEEGGTLTPSEAKFGRVVLEAKKLTGYTEIPNELMADAIVGGAFFQQTFPQALAFFEDDAFLNGSGSGEPLGVFGNPAVQTVTRAVTTGSKEISFADAVKMYARMLPSSLGRAVWLCAPDALPDVLSMELSSGSPAVMLTGGLSAAPAMTLLGRPIVVTEKAPAEASQGALSFVDFGYYLVGDRQAMQAESSAHYKFGNDVTAFRVIERVDGRPWLQSAITPANGSTDKLTPFVEVAAAAA